ncbi:hypothetical protein Q9233_007877, partial [Columba guinea]
MLLESENIQDDRKDGEEECLESQNEDDNRKNNQECSAPEEAPCGNGESEHCNDLPIRELQEKRSQERSKPIRERKTRNASASDHDQKTSTSDLEVADSSGKSHSVTEVMKTTADEKTKELEKSTDDSSDETVKIAEGQIVTGTTQKASVIHQSKHGEAKSTSKDSVKKTSETKERALQNAKVSVSERGLSSPHLKKKVKAVASATTASPQYLGTVKVVENKRVQKNSAEIDKAASLRAAAFQGERQKALSARAAREQAAEYSDDKESDKDGTLNGIGKELNGRNSGAGSTKKLVAVDSPLSDEYASQTAADLEKEAADDSTLSFHEKKLPQTMLLESENIQDDRKDGEEECLESQNEDDNRKNNQECSAPEEAPCGNGESEHCNDLPIRELQEKRNQERSKPIRERKTRNASASDHDQKTSTSDLEVADSSGKSHSVTEVMKTTADEKTKELEKSTDDSSDETVKIAEGQIVTGTTQKASVIHQSKHGEAKSTSKDSVKKTSETKERALQNAKVSVSERGLSSPHLKKKVKAVASATTASPQYLGTVKVVENKRVQKNSAEIDKAASLRAAAFQNWLEKKRAALLQSKRIEKEKAENLRNNIEKKEAVKREEANAAFEAWKKKKAIEAKKLREKKKLEELKEKKATEQNKEKAEAAQKGERQKALSARAAREQAAEYSDDKESDKDGTLNVDNVLFSGIGKELNGRNSGAGSTKKLVAVDSPLSDEYASQTAADLEKEAADDSTLSFHEKKLPQTMLLESENIQDDRKDGEEECLESQNEDDNRKNNQECSAPEEAPCGNGESEHCNDLPIRELQEKRNQ